MKSKIFLAFFLCFFAINTVFAGDWDFKLPTLSLKENLSPLYPKNRPFGTSAFWGDSSSYFIFNQGVKMWGALYTLDSLIVTNDAYVYGSIYFDTTGTGRLYYTGYNLYLENTKSGGGQYYYIGEGNSKFYWYKNSGGTSLNVAILDTVSGFTLNQGNIQLTGGTQQIKFPSDTATDYDLNDTLTVNRQSGTLTTQTLSTAALGDKNIWLQNSLVSTTSKVFAVINDNQSAAGTPIIRQVKTFSGYALIVIYNAHATNALNGAMTISFLVTN